MAQKVLVIGCGIIGAASAYYLKKNGWQVAMVDRGDFGRGSSHGNCGYICPSHVLPLTMPGMIRKTLPMMLRRDAPLRVKPRLDPSLWWWLFRFARECRHEPMMATAHTRHILLQSSRALYEKLIDEEGIDCEWESKGSFFVFRNAGPMEDYTKLNRLMEEFGVAAKRFDGEAVRDLEPALKTGLAGGWHHECDAHLRPDKLLSSMRAVLERMGVEIRENTEVRGFVREGQAASAVETSQGPIPADCFVLATGAWTPQLNRWLGMNVPIQPGKGYSMTMPRPATCPQLPLIFPECKVAVTPMRSGYRLGSTMEFAGYDTSLNPVRLGALKRGAEDYLIEPYCEPVEETWYGWRPMTFDGRPIIDRAPALKNVMLAAGHNMLGVSMGTATGKLVAELICDQTPHIDPRPYAVDRF